MGEGMCHKCNGISLLIVGAVFVANYYMKFVDWQLLVGALLVLGGVMKMVKPHCGCGVPCGICSGWSGNAAKPAKAGKKK